MRDHGWTEAQKCHMLILEFEYAHSTSERHNPKTVRKNQGETYRGCLRIDVHHSADLYRKIEGWATANMADGAAQATC
jgi:hypothetical protein